MILRHSIIRQAVTIFAVLLLCIPLQSNSQHVNKIMQQKTAALLGTYYVSFKSETGVLRYILHIDSTRGMFFYGRMENDQRYHPKWKDFCHIKGILAPGKNHDFIMKPDLRNNLPYNLVCRPHEWVLNNKVYFRFREENIISGYMVVSNDFNAPPFSFSGMKQESEHFAASADVPLSKLK
ncbi:hypothetical protein [Chitinophaga barathri]|uniref:Uncharacterized protein n=1 Tax=Chitinophaga barathri TaxID=1647451 RepID=A0A3N4MRL4_9BACT|nr:hypothetical protein [Chitinophaga barathri]RPD42219.1 hypothetical protein EG028_03295 [Chitinophaga barathri]